MIVSPIRLLQKMSNLTADNFTLECPIHTKDSDRLMDQVNTRLNIGFHIGE
jgi:hypothetical protein